MHEHAIIVDALAKELRALLKDGDFSLATRLLLDFLTDAEQDKDLFDKALHIRAGYNRLEELAPQEKEAGRKALERDFYNMIAQFAGAEESGQVIPAKPKSLSMPFHGKKQDTVIFSGANIAKKYGSGKFQLKQLQVALKAGELTGVVGANGNGKTTLLRIIAGDLTSSWGKTEYPGIPAEAGNWYQIKQHIAFIPQQLPKWNGLLRENLHFSAANHGIFSKENEEMVNYIIHRLGLSKYENAKWSDISSGYRLRFELARALVWHPRLLVLDEPLANLDINAKLLFMQDLRLIANIRRFPLSVILSSQQLHEIESVVDNIIFLEEGSAIYNGPVSEFGQDRQENSFELSGNFTREELYELLASLENITIEDTGQSFVVNTPTSVEAGQIITLISAQKKLGYFRDISQSTRKLFKNRG